jgi:hypothetical protein
MRMKADDGCKKKIHGFTSGDNYEYLLETKSNLIHDGYIKGSVSMLIELGICELRKNMDYNEIKEKLIENEMI